MSTWALVLAAGEGSRLRALTTTNGVAVPKQFCSLQGGPSLRRHDLDRQLQMPLTQRRNRGRGDVGAEAVGGRHPDDPGHRIGLLSPDGQP